MVVKKLGLPLLQDKSFKVTVADGEVIQGKGYCFAISFIIQGNTFTMDLLVVHMGEPQIILGTV